MWIGYNALDLLKDCKNDIEQRRQSPVPAVGSGEGNGNNSSTLQTGLSAGQFNTGGLEECMMSQVGVCVCV